MNSDLVSLLPWGFLTIFAVVLAVGFGYVFYKDRDRRKLMFMLAFAFASLTYLPKMQTEWENIQIIENLYYWSSLPILSAVLIVVLSSLLKLEDFNKPFKAFLFTIATSIIMMVVPLPVQPLHRLLFQGMSMIVVVVSIYLILTRREISDLMFLLSMVCFISGGLGTARGLGVEFSVFAYVFAYVFIALVFIASKESVEGGIASFFALKRELKETQEKRERAEEALKESEEKFRTLAEQSPNMIFINKKGRVVYANKKCEEIMGYKREEFYSPDFDFLTLIAPEYIDLVKSNYSRHMKGEEVAPFEYALITKEGKRIDAILATRLIRYGEENAILGTVTDITELKKAEEALRESEEKFRNLFESANDAMIYLDGSGRILDVNEKAVEVFGGSKKELLGKHFTKVGVFSHGDLPALERTFANIIAGKEADLNIHIKNKKDQEINLECSASLMKIGDKISGMLIIARDVTERKKMEDKLKEYAERLEEIVAERTRELRESEEKYRGLFENANVAIVHLDLTGKILDINRRAEEIAGQKKEEIVGKNFAKLGLVSLGDVPKLLGYLKRKIEDKSMTGIELTITRKDGEKRFIEINSTILRRNNIPQSVLAVVRDITQRKKAEEQLLRSERLAAIGEVATIVGHDLRNPLTSIQNACYYLKMKLGDTKDEKIKRMFRIIDREINYTNKIIRDLLDFSKIKKLELKKVDLISSIQDAIAQLKFPENITLTTKFGDVPAIEADPDQLRRIFQNIALNGIQAMPNGGELIVSARKNGDFVEDTFTDTGVGIPEENMDKLFTPLFTTKAQGVGLGLTICKNLVEAHNGRIEVRSKVGEGSTFTVKLPIHQTNGGEKQI